MSRILLQLDNRGRITIPAELRKKWNVAFGDYIVIDSEKKIIDRVNIITDQELRDPEVIDSILKLGKKAKEDFHDGKTRSLDNYINERGISSEV